MLWLSGERSGTVVPMTSEDQSMLYDPHDYDEVPMDENKSPPPPSPPAVVKKLMSRVPGPPTRPLPEIKSERALPETKHKPSLSDRMYTEVSNG